MNRIFATDSFQRHKHLINEEELKGEFMMIGFNLQLDEVLNLETLVKELKVYNIDNLWRMGPNFMQLVRSCMVFGAVSAEAERSFSKMKIIKSKLRNKMSDDRLNNLIVLKDNPSLLE